MESETPTPSPLPRGVYLKHGAYYLVKDGRWHWLTKDQASINAALASIIHVVPSGMDEIAAHALRQLARSRANAKGRRGLPHELQRQDIMEMLWEARWACAVTCVPFSLQLVGPRDQRPFAPSIDRLDNSRGYVRDNCRMVCVAANIAMNTWGAEALYAMLRHAKPSKSIRRPK